MGQSMYLCESWQGLIQQLQTAVSSGYRYYQEIKPTKAIDDTKWLRIDERLISRFDTGIGKDKRYRNKKKKLANYIYLRFQNFAYLLRSEGDIDESVAGEKFIDVTDTPLTINVGNELQLKIGKSLAGRGFTVYMTNECYKEKKATMLELLEHRNIKELVFRFGILNGIPAYAGVNNQKEQLRACIFEHAKKNGVVLTKEQFRISYKRKIYKVFSPS